MRLKVDIVSQGSFIYQEINQYFIHSFIWRTLRNTEFRKLHDQTFFKYFTFSNIFPVKDYSEGDTASFIISSPNKPIIEALYDQIRRHKLIKLGNQVFSLKSIKKIELSPRRYWYTATPLVLYKDNRTGTYFSFHRDHDIEFFINRIKDNAVKKYAIYYRKEISEIKIPRHLFTSFEFKKSVSYQIRKNRRKFIVIGTIGLFELPKIRSRRVSDFYKFIMDTGLGEKNSFGFGFINPLVAPGQTIKNSNS